MKKTHFLGLAIALMLMGLTSACNKDDKAVAPAQEPATVESILGAQDMKDIKTIASDINRAVDASLEQYASSVPGSVSKEELDEVYQANLIATKSEGAEIVFSTEADLIQQYLDVYQSDMLQAMEAIGDTDDDVLTIGVLNETADKFMDKIATDNSLSSTAKRDIIMHTMVSQSVFLTYLNNAEQVSLLTEGDLPTKGWLKNLFQKKTTQCALAMVGTAATGVAGVYFAPAWFVTVGLVVWGIKTCN